MQVMTATLSYRGGESGSDGDSSEKGDDSENDSEVDGDDNGFNSDITVLRNYSFISAQGSRQGGGTRTCRMS